MEVLYSLPYQLLEVPNIKVKWPSWFRQPSSMGVYAMVLLSYFLVTGGVIYDIITETPGYGTVTDERGTRTVAILPHRVNGQYVIEGLTSSFMFTLGGLGFIVLNQTHSPTTPKFNRLLLIAVGFLFVIVSFCSCWIFMRIKLPGYLNS
ncbi:oligosaccharyltransferase complex subunit ostc isoform X1 [Thrips palmi]|uniref:Oligosaccharyltransferase complex subunit n=2 Tax=Thrips palmi TaxID=161013 RepID=A0A6P8YK27_THRPL|nr:oligosaccharyltransferase complex subunit ostc isoform X1 [Thrips palmi]